MELTLSFVYRIPGLLGCLNMDSSVIMLAVCAKVPVMIINCLVLRVHANATGVCQFRVEWIGRTPTAVRGGPSLILPSGGSLNLDALESLDPNVNGWEEHLVWSRKRYTSHSNQTILI